MLIGNVNIQSVVNIFIVLTKVTFDDAQFIAQSSQGKLADVILEHSLITNESINASK